MTDQIMKILNCWCFFIYIYHYIIYNFIAISDHCADVFHIVQTCAQIYAVIGKLYLLTLAFPTVSSLLYEPRSKKCIMNGWQSEAIIGSVNVARSQTDSCLISHSWQTHNQIINLNTLRPRHNGHHSADNLFKCIFLNEDVWISVPINNIPALVQLMAWCRPGKKSLYELMVVSLLMHVCIIQPKWVKLVLSGTVTPHSRNYENTVSYSMLESFLKVSIV